MSPSWAHLGLAQSRPRWECAVCSSHVDAFCSKRYWKSAPRSSHQFFLCLLLCASRERLCLCALQLACCAREPPPSAFQHNGRRYLVGGRTVEEAISCLESTFVSAGVFCTDRVQLVATRHVVIVGKL